VDECRGEGIWNSGSLPFLKVDTFLSPHHDKLKKDALNVSRAYMGAIKKTMGSLPYEGKANLAYWTQMI